LIIFEGVGFGVLIFEGYQVIFLKTPFLSKYPEGYQVS